MAYNNKNYLEKIKQAVEVTKAHYEPGGRIGIIGGYGTIIFMICFMSDISHICPGCAGTLIIALISSG